MTNAAPTLFGRLWRFTKRLALVTTVLTIAAITAVGVGVPAATRTAWARARLEKKLTRELGTPVHVGAMSWSWKNGLTLQEVNTPATDLRTAFHVDRVRLQPKYSKLLGGKLRLRATVENPELFVSEAGKPLKLPRFPKKGPRIDQVDIVSASVTVKTAGEIEPVRLDDVTVRGTGRMEDRALKIDVASVSGSCEGVTFSGRGALRLCSDGLGGQIGMNEAAAKESASLRKALRALGLSSARPALSEEF
jgi:hypothetical protein